MKFILNGDEVEVDRVSYEDIVEMAGHKIEHSPIVTYRHAGSEGVSEGSMRPGTRLIVCNKTVVNCADTSNT